MPYYHVGLSIVSALLERRTDIDSFTEMAQLINVAIFHFVSVGTGFISAYFQALILSLHQLVPYRGKF